ncbi:hypothetical protein [Azoarcus olearius]|uniref:Uncharacterized protein n=1 Tax=Azoarcus sp. (strain BH72) TaxID=418699 RepID=A1K349_AZOSB|nr:hypothetical protein [Azoarcus olearius]ANQ83781.1 hypothetical protein dqs_0706 [Azoarcus olearius]CAL93254.1 Hypothetical protein azo0637 [Azoarcus olearius]
MNDTPHDQLEALAADILTLTEEVDAEGLARSRLTRGETIKRLRRMAAIAAALPDEARAALPEMDWARWLALGEDLAADRVGPLALWTAAREFTTDTLQWLRVYREANPNWYRPAPDSGATLS